MKNLLNIEIKRSLNNIMFFVSTLFGTVLCLVSAVQRITYEMGCLKFDNPETVNPLYEVDSAFAQWIGVESGSPTFFVFFMLIPLLAVLPYATSFLDDTKNGYARTLCVRGKRGQYVMSKYFATFFSGAVTVLIPVLCNIAAVSVFFPFSKPDVLCEFYYSLGFHPGYFTLFYTKPYLFMLLFVVLITLYSGLFAVVAMTFSFVIKNKYIVMVLPFFICFVTKLISDRLHLSLDLSPIDFLHPGFNYSPLWYIIGLFVVCLAVTFGLTLYKGRKNDVF